MKNVEIVSADRGTGLEERGELELVTLDELARDQAFLKLARYIELLLEALLLRFRLDRLLQSLRHLIEGSLQGTDLIRSPDRNADAEVARL